MKTKTAMFAILSAVLGLVSVTSVASASSHREAPAIAEDQFADNTDVYTFISPSDPNRVVFVANYVPLLIPHSGPNYYKFSDSVLYEIRIDNDGDADPDISYQYTFDTRVINGATFLYNTGAVDSLTDDNLNVRQTYRLVRRNLDTGARTVIATDAPVAPWNVGSRSFPGGYEAVAQMATTSVVGGGRSFAGPRDEPFFVDLHVFDLLGVGGFQSTNGVNVMSIVLEVPISEVAAGGVRPASGATGPSNVIGVYATASRRQVQILRRRRGADDAGQWIQVSRLGWPLVNEVVIPLQDKDHFNRTSPEDDVANYGAYIVNPEVNGLLRAVLGLPCAMTPPTGRTDIVALLSPSGTTPADLLRLDIREGQTNAMSHFPNGRALADDVTDTLLTVVCNGGIAVGDGVDANDLPFTSTFPYLASPHSGNPGPS